MEKTIVNANSLEAKDELMSIIAKIHTLQKTDEQVEQWLLLNLGTDLFGVWLLFDEADPVGVVISEVTNDGDAYIAFEWTKSGVGKEGLLDRVERWAKKLEIGRLVKYTTKSPTTYIKKFGWSVWQTVLVKEL